MVGVKKLEKIAPVQKGLAAGSGVLGKVLVQAECFMVSPLAVLRVGGFE